MNRFLIVVVTIIAILFVILSGFYLYISYKASRPDYKFLQKYYDELAVNPNSATAYMEIARANIIAYPKPYDTEKALADISKAIELDSKLTEAYNLRAMLYYYTIKDTEKALNDINKALEIEPDNEFALDFKRGILSDYQ